MLGREAIEEIRNFFERRAELWVVTTRSGVVGLTAAILTLAAAFFLDFTAAALVAAVDLGSSFLGAAVFLVAVTFGCTNASVTGCGEGLWR
jgi:VIT1/CCC1 family predicted Fe2+/Mn2+ transporter